MRQITSVLCRTQIQGIADADVVRQVSDVQASPRLPSAPIMARLRPSPSEARECRSARAIPRSPQPALKTGFNPCDVEGRIVKGKIPVTRRSHPASGHLVAEDRAT